MASPFRVDPASGVVVLEVVMPDQGPQNPRVALRRPSQTESFEVDPPVRVLRRASGEFLEVDEDLVLIGEGNLHGPNRSVGGTVLDQTASEVRE
jgi:hypothetical protein